MKAEDFIEKFGLEKGQNKCCLLDMGCPKCGQREEFRVTVETFALITDDGTDCNVDAHEWDNESSMLCRKCWESGTAAEFTHEGLDAMIKERKGTQ